MPTRRKASRKISPTRKTSPSVKKLLADVLSKPWAQPKVIVRKLVDSDIDDATTTPRQLSMGITSTSSSTLKRVEQEIKKEYGASPEPTLLDVPSSTRVELSQKTGEIRDPVSANSGFIYSPMYRLYYGLTPPNPRLFNPRLLEDYIDWYMNVYLEEETLPWEWISVGDVQARKKHDEEQVSEEAKRIASFSSTPTME